MNDWPGIRLLQWCREYGKESIMNIQTDHDLLVRIDERTERLEIWSSNHDKHHFRYNLMAWGIALGAIVSLILVIVKAI